MDARCHDHPEPDRDGRGFPLIVLTLGGALLVGRLLHSIGLMGNAEAFNSVAGMVITIGVMAISSVIGIIEYFAPGSF
jgi:uncharacterized membrane protein YecN with MAPEG domain